jgi:Sulfotransferase domain
MANLFIVGAPKCGTTAWVEYLQTHPDIFFTEKENCFFALDLPNFRFVHSDAQYAELFAASGDAKIIGEASAMYLFSEVAAGAIRQYNPDAKILIFLRDQEEYLPSLHNQFLREFAEAIEDFEMAWRLSGRRPAETVPKTCLEPRTLDYAAMGRFREQVERYLAAFPAEQVRVIRFGDWVANPRATYLEILVFLGVEDDGRVDFPTVNPGMRFRSQSLARFLLYPPTVVRKLVRLVKRVFGLQGSIPYQKTMNLVSARGYRKDISPELRDEIRAYYREDNRLLDEAIRR